MKKQLLYLLALSMIFIQTSNIVFSKTTSLSNPVRIAIKKYKAGNYTGCLQDCKNIIYHDPSNAVAYYYLAMAYAQAGDKDNAIKAYTRVLGLAPNARLSQYAQTGKRCLETPDKCHDDSGASPDPDLDKFMGKPDVMVSDKVQQGFRDRALKNIQNEINTGKEMDNYDLNQIKQRTDAGSDDKIAQNKPTDAEIVKALKVLNAAGLNPYGQTQTQPQAQIQPQTQAQPDTAVSNLTPMVPAQNPEMAQLSALINQGNSNNNNNEMMNMLPYMMMQKNKDGSSNYSPQLMQAVIMNSMMPNLNFDMDKDNK